MLYLGIEKAKTSLPTRHKEWRARQYFWREGQIRRKAETQSLWVLNYQDSRVAEETADYHDPKDLCLLGHLFLRRKRNTGQSFMAGCIGAKMRPPRIYKEETVYYITCRASNEESLFRQESDYLSFLEILAERKQKYDFKLYAYCLLPKHYHLMIEPTHAESLSKIMQALNTSYSLYFNKKYNRTGHLLSGRFESKMFGRDEALLEQAVHMHLNPLRVGLTKDPADYKWCSHQEYAGLNNNILTDKDFILSFLRDGSCANRRSVPEGDNSCFSGRTVPDTYEELIGAGAQKIMGQMNIGQAQPALLSVPAEKSHLRKSQYAFLAVAMLALILILPHLVTQRNKGSVITPEPTKELSVNLPDGLPFSEGFSTRKNKQAWEVWKVGPFAQGDTDALAQ